MLILIRAKAKCILKGALERILQWTFCIKWINAVKCGLYTVQQGAEMSCWVPQKMTNLERKVEADHYSQSHWQYLWTTLTPDLQWSQIKGKGMSIPLSHITHTKHMNQWRESPN